MKRSFALAVRVPAFLLALGAAAGMSSQVAQAAPPLASVVVAPVTQQNLAPSFSNIGHVIAIQSVKLVPRVTAFINEVNVKQGSTVTAGEVMFTLQPEQYEAALESAQASLASAQAALENSQLIYERAARLNTTGFESEQSLDEALATRNEDQANVLSAKANVATAQLNLSYCTITAPIAGRIGAVSLTKGNLVTPTSGSLALINQIDPIRVEFSVSTSSPILAAAAGAASSQFEVTLALPNGKPYAYKGKIAFLDNQVDTNTGTENIYADFPNPQSQLLPGAYVAVVTSSVQPEEVLTVPVAAVQTDQNSDFVLVVGPDSKVKQQTIVTGRQIAQNFVVKSGLTVNDKVIVDGIQKVKDGDQVTYTIAPTPPPATGPSDDSASQ